MVKVVSPSEVYTSPLNRSRELGRAETGAGRGRIC
jgi:hypothetical protein